MRKVFQKNIPRNEVKWRRGKRHNKTCRGTPSSVTNSVGYSTMTPVDRRFWMDDRGMMK
jgi:hypothetical protein